MCATLIEFGRIIEPPSLSLSLSSSCPVCCVFAEIFLDTWTKMLANTMWRAANLSRTCRARAFRGVSSVERTSRRMASGEFYAVVFVGYCLNCVEGYAKFDWEVCPHALSL